MGGYSIPFNFKTEGLSDLEKVQKIIEQVGKTTNASAGDLRIFDAILKQTVSTGGNFQKELAAIAKGGKEVSQGLQELAKQGQAAHAAMLRVSEGGKQASTSSNQFASSILRIGQSAGLVDSQMAGMTRGIAGLGGGMSSLTALLTPATLGIAGVGLGAGIAAKELFNAAAAVAHYAQEQQNGALRTGLSIVEYQQFSRAAAVAGVNAGSLTTAMRSLSRGLAEGGDEGKKQSAALNKLGIEAYYATGQLKPMSDIIGQIFKQLAARPAGAERDSIAVTLFGRGGLELLPLVGRLEELKNKVKETGVVMDQEGASKAIKYAEQLTLLKDRWESVKLSFGQSAVGIISFVVQAMQLPPVGTQSGAQGDKYMSQLRRQMYGTTVPIAGPSRGDFLGGLTGTFGQANDLIAGKDVLEKYINADPDRKMRKLQTEFSALESPQAGQTEAENRSRVARRNAKQAEINALQAQIDKTKELAGVQERLNALMEKAATLGMLPAAQLYREMGQLVRDGANPNKAFVATQKLVNAELAKGQSASNAIGLWFAGEQNKFNENVSGQFDSEVKTMQGGTGRFVHDFLRQVGEAKSRTQKEDSQEIGEIRDNASRRARLIGINAGQGQEVAALRAERDLRLDAVAQEMRIYEKHGHIYDMDVERWRLTKEANAAQLQFEDAIAEKKRREMRAFQSEVVRGFDALVSGQGLGSFFKDIAMGQANTIVGNAARSVYESKAVQSMKGVGGAIKPDSQIGKLLAGTMFDGSGKVDSKIDVSNLYLQSIDTTIKAMATGNTAGIAGGAAGGGKYGNIFGGATRNPFIYNFGGPGAATGGFAADGMPAFGGQSLANALGIASMSVPTSQATFLGLSKSALGKGIGYAGAAAGGVLGAVDGFGHGGARGATEGVGSLAGAAGSIMMLAGVSGPAAPILAGVGLALGVITGLFGDPKANRQNQLNKELGNSRYFAPVSLHANMDTSGNYTDYGADGMIRQSPFRGIPEVTQPYQWYKNGQYQQYPGRTISPFQDPNVPFPGKIPGLPDPVQGGPTWRQGGAGVTNVNLTINALDSKNIKDRAGDIADALHHAIQSGRAEGFMAAHTEARGR